MWQTEPDTILHPGSVYNIPSRRIQKKSESNLYCTCQWQREDLTPPCIERAQSLQTNYTITHGYGGFLGDIIAWNLHLAPKFWLVHQQTKSSGKSSLLSIEQAMQSQPWSRGQSNQTSHVPTLWSLHVQNGPGCVARYNSAVLLQSLTHRFYKLVTDILQKAQPYYHFKFKCR